MLAIDQAREWQKQALICFRKSNNRGIVEVATGGGKTIFALLAFEYLKKNQIIERILVIVPTQALADQWFVNFVEDLGLEPDSVALLSSNATTEDLRLANIVVINSARNISFETRIQTSTFLVVDECHRAGSEENSRALRGSWIATLGLSATPERQYDDGTLRHVIPSLGKVIYRYTVKDALKDHVLSPFEIHNVCIPLLNREEETIAKINKRIARAMNRVDSDEEVLEALLRQRARLYNGAQYRVPAVARILSDHRGERAMVFHESIDHANQIAEILVAQGHSVAAYHSRISDNVRRENLRLFRRGVIDVLVTCRALDEGANMPETVVAVVAAASASTRQRIQRLGRVLRPAPGKEYAIVYTLYATQIEEKRLLEEANALEGVASVHWKKMSDGK